MLEKNLVCSVLQRLHQLAEEDKVCVSTSQRRERLDLKGGVGKFRLDEGRYLVDIIGE